MKRLTPSNDVLTTIDEFLKDQDITTLVIKRSNGSPWTEVDLWVHERGIFKFAIWNATLKVYEVNPYGAVEDDPIEAFPVGLSPHRDLAL